MIDKTEYIKRLQSALEKTLNPLKSGIPVKPTYQSYLYGYMEAALRLGVMNNEELNKIVEEVNYQIFGMSVKEREEVYKSKIKKVGPDQMLDIPTFIRQGKNFNL